MTPEDTSGRDDLEGLPAAYAAWRESVLGQITDALEERLLLDRIGPARGHRILDVAPDRHRANREKASKSALA
jgi:hypothetical protein